MGVDVATPEWKRKALEMMAVGICLNRHRVTHSLVEVNIKMYKAYKQLKEVNHLDLELPYYWGEFGVHVVYKQFTNLIKVNGNDPEDWRFVELGDVDFLEGKPTNEKK